MAQLTDVIAYLLAHYPHKGELSNARVTKMVYLADWHQAISRDRQITDIDWYFDNFGPFVWKVSDTVNENPLLFDRQETETMFGNHKSLFSLRDDTYTPQLGTDEKASLDHVIKQTKDRNWDQFIKLVYSTHPVVSSPRYSRLNLVEKAREYKDPDR